MIALQEDSDDAELSRRFHSWLNSSVENERAWNEIQRTWKLLGKGGGAAPSSRSTPKHVRRSRYNSPPGAGVAVAGIAALCLALLFQSTINIWFSADYATGTAEARTIRLEDGSLVHLGANSAIDIAYGSSLRQVRLLSGKAYFEVEPDMDRPFLVGAGTVEATVLGTAFDVELASSTVVVAVNHGRVGISTGNAEQVLQKPLEAGDWVRVDGEGQVESGNDEPDLAGSWRSGTLVVKDRPVVEVLEVIDRHYVGKVLLPDRRLGQRRVTGVYDLRKPMNALDAVAQAHGAQARQIGPWLTVITRY